MEANKLNIWGDLLFNREYISIKLVFIYVIMK